MAEYCAPVWSRSAHTNLVDVKLRDSMRTITGCLKSTPTQWLPVLSRITPPHLRREEMNQKWIQKAEQNNNTPLPKIYQKAPSSSRLKTRSPFYLSKNANFDLGVAWRDEWHGNLPKGGDVIKDPTERQPGFDRKRKYWVSANRLLLSRHGRTAVNMNKLWGLSDSTICPQCQIGQQDTDHLVLHCPVTKLEGGFETIRKCDDDFHDWLDKHNLKV